MSTSLQDAEGRPPGYSLSARITVIVFWGLTIAGLVVSVLLLRNIRSEAVAHRNAVADRLAYQLQRAPGDPKAPVSATGTLARLVDALPVSGAELRVDGRVVARSGRAGPASVVRPLEWRGRPARLAVGFPPLRETVNSRRSHLLMGLGVLLLAFGLLLKQVLERVLTRPVGALVHTARRLSQGATDLRFPDSRQDELGYLAQFINRALDALVEQQAALSRALEQVRSSETELARAKELAEVTLHSIGDAVITTDQHARVHYLNPVAEALTGFSTAQARGRPLDQVMPLVAERTGERLEHPMQACLREVRVVKTKLDAALVRADASTVPIVDTAAPIRGADGVILGGVMVFHDVSHMRRLQHELTHQASHDMLTGLYNRREFERRLQQALEPGQRDTARHSICYLDLDQFKVINDTCGHEAGDELLRQISAQLQRLVRSADLFARLGGDEFVVLLMHCPLDTARMRAEQFREAVESFRFHWGNSVFQVGVSVGVVEIDATTSSVGEVLGTADMACYAAKEGGRARVHVYDPDDAELKKRRGEMGMVSRIRDALKDERFCLFCQPVVPVIPHAGDERRYEVLVRMRDDSGRLIAPGAFIPAAERYQLMTQVDKWVVGEALRLLDQHPGPVCFSVNLSGQSLGDEGFRDFLTALLRERAALAPRVCFEITETAAITNLNRATDLLNRLRDSGCRLALDDFGSGLSSFGYLKNLPVDYLKIDGAFVRAMDRSRAERAAVRAINDIGHELGMCTVAEFVESEAVFRAVRALGVDYAQGYWISRPFPVEELGGEVKRLGAGL